MFKKPDVLRNDYNRMPVEACSILGEQNECNVSLNFNEIVPTRVVNRYETNTPRGTSIQTTMYAIND